MMIILMMITMLRIMIVTMIMIMIIMTISLMTIKNDHSDGNDDTNIHDIILFFS